MLKKFAAVFFLFVSSFIARGQAAPDSCSLEVSLLTCAPGTDLYSIFGHTAIRIQDKRRDMDIIYNYGMFNDTDPMFYLNFTKGIMRYSLGAETFDSFMVEYQMEQRPVVSQMLNLNCAEKKRIYEALRSNTLEENRFYDYRFHTDNCTTRAGKMIEGITDKPLLYNNILPTPGPSFRDMIHEYLDPQDQKWAKFGIDLLLGKNLDIKPTNVEAIHFLPDYLFRGMDSASAGDKKLVGEKTLLLQFDVTKTTASFFTPLLLTQIILLLCITLYVLRPRLKLAKALRIFDIVFFTVLGLFGLLIATVWLIRVDTVCRDNMNILWATPTHLVAVMFLRKKPVWLKYFFLVAGLISLILLAGFPWWMQRMNIAVVPLLAIIIFRSVDIFYRLHSDQNLRHAQTAVV